MTRFLTRLLGRLPIGWLQLVHNRARFAAALAGVAFANVLVFVQIAIMGSMATATIQPYRFFDADIMISAADANAIAEGSHVPRQWLFQSLAHPQVASGTPLFVGNVSLQRHGRTISLTTFAIDPAAAEFYAPDIARKSAMLRLPDSGIIDINTRGLDRAEAALIRPQSPDIVEVRGRSLSLQDTFAGGGGFGADGFLIVSDQTFQHLVQQRSSTAPDHILLHVTGGADAERVAADLRQILPDDTLRIRTYAEAQREDVSYQQTKRPTGIIFGFGVVIGILVGLVIVYQVLSTDVADHLREYATFKAMGYRHRFLLGIVLEEAVILATLGAVPGTLIALGLVTGMRAATNLPLAITPAIVAMVFVGTLVACALSGTLATRRLASADPAELF
ncbi:FtsX-like permease family protein [Paracoccus jeotgali]|uniref:ABC transporter permease n=1 Tax=Paracoccus jeotgali TaxID=2065379 RepID=A0A2K9MI70_9RHOB|nr:FtsX-like permease family protein [Paracoccus jeotgali]AUM75321.1 ABC transporter permease [Paracoccus jeotgali]